MASGRVVTTLAAYRNLSLTGTGVVVKASPGEVAGYHIANRAAAERFVKFYDKATAALSSDTPVITIPLAANSAANVLANAGVDFSTGISLRASALIADSDQTAPDANDVVVNIYYR